MRNAFFMVMGASIAVRVTMLAVLAAATAHRSHETLWRAWWALFFSEDTRSLVYEGLRWIGYLAVITIVGWVNFK